MRIAIIHHNSDLDNDYGAYLSTLLDEVCSENGYPVKEHFLLRLRKEQVTGKNVVIHFLINTQNPLSQTYWYNLKLPKLLNKYGIEKVISLRAIPVKTNLPQLLLIGDAKIFEPGKKTILQKAALKKLSKKVPERATFLTYSNIVKQELQNRFGITEERVQCITYSAPPVFHPREWHDKLYLKSRYSENKEYFLCFLREDDVDLFVLLLKSFSVFKKWQNSSMKFLILPKEESLSGKMKDKLNTYKYREDVSLIDDAENREVAEIVSAAYALLHFPVSDSDLWAVTVAMISAVPSICGYTKSSREYVKNGGIILEEKDPKIIGQALINIYKNEQERTKMVDEAEENSVPYLHKYVAANLAALMGILP